MAALPILTCERLNMMTSVREERLRRMISIVACCQSAKLCAHAARDFRSHHKTTLCVAYLSEMNTDQDWIGLKNFCCFNVAILTI